MSEQPVWDEGAGDYQGADGGHLAVVAPVEDPADGTALEGTVVEGTLDISVPLTMDEARELTDKIRSTAEVLHFYLYRAHQGRAWEALGYPTFESYLREEFEMSRSRGYQLLNQAKVIEAIEAVVPDGTPVTLSEAAARDLKSVVGDFMPELAERTRDLPADEAGEVVEELVEEYREKARLDKEREALEREEREADLAERRGFSEDGYSGPYTPPPPPVEDDEDDIDPALVRRNFQAVYDLYSSVSALRGMPSHEDVINTIPVERRVQINTNLPGALAWLNEFAEKWAAQEWQSELAAGQDNSDEVDEVSEEDGEGAW